MDVFELRKELVADYAEYAQSFINIKDSQIKSYVHQSFDEGAFWPDPLIQLNPNFKPGLWIADLVKQGILHPECNRIFVKGKERGEHKPLRLYQHQQDAIEAARAGQNYVLTTGTGSGKSLSYIVPIVDHVLRHGSGKGIQAIIIYPMNALANSQYGELEKFLLHGYGGGNEPVTFAIYTGQQSDEERNQIIAHPPDILLTNYVMLELLLTRPKENKLTEAAHGLRFLVLDELHTYRGRQGADVALLMRRVRYRLSGRPDSIQCVGTSATLASEGSYADQRQEVARVATQIFGVGVLPEAVIGETLQRATAECGPDDREFIQSLQAKLKGAAYLQPPQQYDAFIDEPLSRWIESKFGVGREQESGRLIRQQPCSISGMGGAAQELHTLTGVDLEICRQAIEQWLLAGYACEANPETGFPLFAFRLHQFISPGDTVYASLETEIQRHITIQGQQYVPGDRSRILLPLVFCRECGQEYYSVRFREDEAGHSLVTARAFTDRFNDDEEGEAGYLYLSSGNPWPTETEAIIDRLPDDWLELKNGIPVIRRSRQAQLPRHLSIKANGETGLDGTDAVFIQTPFRFCLHCGVSYGGRQTSDFGKLASLSTEGRSSATTILSLSTILHLQHEETLPARARKLLSFTDNRQDASLQAGHFNDFVEIGLLRSALYRAVGEAGSQGLTHDNLTQQVYQSLNLPPVLYAANPDARFQARADTEEALRDVLGYRLYRDLRRGWRIMSPNLEQVGLLEIDYASLDEVCQAEDVWEHAHATLATASPRTRAEIAKVLLDHMRRELAIKVNYLDARHQERIKQRSSQYLVDPWAVDEDERLEYAAVLFPRPRRPNDYQGNVFLSARGAFGIYLRRQNTFPEFTSRLSLEETDTIIRQLLEALLVAELVQVVEESQGSHDVPGYQVKASGMRWLAGDGTRAFHDPIRVPSEAEGGGRPNPYFVLFYRTVAQTLQGLEAHEHTAQVPYNQRMQREDQFRAGKLPILYCSPTMELGVDIAELNVVNMRNVPPTPANYAQRSGRAGRSGQPALVFTYCSKGSPHDQYFFKRPEAMVTGAVAPPRLDLANEDLVRAHIHAVWLSEASIELGTTLKEVLDLTAPELLLPLQQDINHLIQAKQPKQRAMMQASRLLDAIVTDLSQASWYRPNWLDGVFTNITQEFDRTCDRWRELYRAAMQQAEAQDEIIRDATRSAADKRQAHRLRREAEAQLEILTEAENLAQSDFYSYRYFASEGFLPGYSFPRLPISAFIPARRVRQRDEFLSRPRFLAISEFGPRAIIYHEGSRYLINQVILPVDEDGPLTGQVKQCSNCGYLHPIKSGDGPDRCERCGFRLDVPLRKLLRMQNVVTKRRDRINSDEEERVRMGYDIRTGVRFPLQDGQSTHRTATVKSAGNHVLAKLTYAQAATIWRINLGWARRKQQNQFGFVLDLERGYWARNEQTEDDPSDPMSERTERVIPYVEDRRNCLLFEPEQPLEIEEMASLQAALKRAIQARYQLEDNELAVEPLPDSATRKLLLFYEAAEGGAGVLRRLLEEPHALADVAREALRICHFNPDTGEDLRHAPRAQEECEAACYDCLLSYGNQREHVILDRQAIKRTLADLAVAVVEASPVAAGRDEHLASLLRLCDSELERQWLRYLHERGYRLPTYAQQLIEECDTRPDFFYPNHHAAIYVDGPMHEFPQRQARDRQQEECLEDDGYTVIRFGLPDEWDAVVKSYPYVFGEEA